VLPFPLVRPERIRKTRYGNGEEGRGKSGFEQQEGRNRQVGWALKKGRRGKKRCAKPGVAQIPTFVTYHEREEK